MKCPRKSCKNKAIEHAVYGIIPCQKCQNKDNGVSDLPEFLTLSKQTRITGQRDKHGKDILQPWHTEGGKWKPNPDFVKSYPEYRKSYFTPEQLKDVI